MVNITANIMVIMGMRNDLGKLQIRNGDIGEFSFNVFCFIIKHEEN